jgi:hypothetical protein
MRAVLIWPLAINTFADTPFSVVGGFRGRRKPTLDPGHKAKCLTEN